MEGRIIALDVIPEIVQQATLLQRSIDAVGLDRKLVELVKIRASQLNGCAYCLHSHTQDALKLGETPTRIFLLSAWRESTLFSARERAALAWTDRLTLIAQNIETEALFSDLKALFTDEEIAVLNSTIAMINLWNRWAIGLGYVHAAENETPR